MLLNCLRWPDAKKKKYDPVSWPIPASRQVEQRAIARECKAIARELPIVATARESSETVCPALAKRRDIAKQEKSEKDIQKRLSKFEIRISVLEVFAFLGVHQILPSVRFCRVEKHSKQNRISLMMIPLFLRVRPHHRRSSNVLQTEQSPTSRALQLIKKRHSNAFSSVIVFLNGVHSKYPRFV